MTYKKIYDREENRWIDEKEYNRLCKFLADWEIVIRFRVYYSNKENNNPVD